MIDEFEIELGYAGALDDDAMKRVRSQPELAATDAELRALEAWWRERPRVLPAQRAPTPRVRPMLWVFTALAAAVLVVSFGVGSPAGDPGYRAMGSLAVDASATRDGAPLAISGDLRGGDVVRISLIPDRTGYLTIATLQSDGVVSSIVADLPVRRGKRFVLDGGVRLDDHVGAEWLIVTIETERTPDLRALLPAPTSGPGRAVVPLRGVSP